MTGSIPTKKRSCGTRVLLLALFLLLGTATVVLFLKNYRQEKELIVPATINLSENLLLADTSQHSVKLVVSGSPSALKQLDTRTVGCQLDLSGLSKGTHIVVLSSSDIKLPNSVVLTKLLTPSLTITLETPPFAKRVDVIAVLKGKPAPGYAVTGVSLKPDHIVIKGSASKLEKIDTVKTQPIDLETASESFKKEVPLDLPETIGVTTSTRIVVAKINVSERIITRVFEKLPVLGKGLDIDYTIHPETIDLTLTGPETIVKAAETDRVITVTVDLTGLSSGTHLLRAAIHLPVQVTLIHANPEQFKVEIAK